MLHFTSSDIDCRHLLGWNVQFVFHSDLCPDCLSSFIGTMALFIPLLFKTQNESQKLVPCHLLALLSYPEAKALPKRKVTKQNFSTLGEKTPQLLIIRSSPTEDMSRHARAYNTRRGRMFALPYCAAVDPLGNLDTRDSGLASPVCLFVGTRHAILSALGDRHCSLLEIQY